MAKLSDWMISNGALCYCLVFLTRSAEIQPYHVCTNYAHQYFLSKEYNFILLCTCGTNFVLLANTGCGNVKFKNDCDFCVLTSAVLMTFMF